MWLGLEVRVSSGRAGANCVERIDELEPSSIEAVCANYRQLAQGEGTLRNA